MSESQGVDRRALLKGSTATVIMALLRGESAAAASALSPSSAVSRQPGALTTTGNRVFSANQTVTTLIADRLYRIGCVVRAESLSWLPEDLDAYEPLNGYLLLDEKNCLFNEMGSPVMLPAIQSALNLVGKRKVHVWFSRNEADCIGNMGYIFGSCPNPTLLFGAMAGGILEWINDPAVTITEVRDFLGRIPVESVRNGVKRKLGAFDLSYMDAGSKQMIMTQWVFDATTGTMFTSDSFGFRHLKSVNDSTIITSPKGLPTVDTVAKEIVARFNWMREAEFPDSIERFEMIFKEHDVQILAPVHGCVIKGRDAVRAHVKLMADAMRAAGKLPTHKGFNMSRLPANTVFKTYISRDLPRMVTPDLAWIGGCTDPRGAPLRDNSVEQPLTEMNHGHCVAYVILGTDKTAMLDPGHFGLWYTMDSQLDQVLKGRSLDYIFVSHQEIPHTGNLGRLMAKYPNSVAIGDVRDYHLFHPEVELHRFKHMKHGDSLDLGDRELVILDAIWKDLSGTMYAYDTRLKLIYTADVFEFSHRAEPNTCGMMLHEMSDDYIDKFTDSATAGPIFGGRYRNQRIRVAAFRNLMHKYPIEIITSGHYGPLMGKALKPAMEKTLTAIVERQIDWKS